MDDRSGTNVMISFRNGKFKTYKDVRYAKCENGVLEMSLANEPYGERDILHQRITVPLDLIEQIHEIHTCSIAEHKANVASFEEWKTAMRGGMHLVTGIADADSDDLG